MAGVVRHSKPGRDPRPRFARAPFASGGGAAINTAHRPEHESLRLRGGDLLSSLTELDQDVREVLGSCASAAPRDLIACVLLMRSAAAASCCGRNNLREETRRARRSLPGSQGSDPADP